VPARRVVIVFIVRYGRCSSLRGEMQWILAVFEKGRG
jgi:hypothetical protein